MVFLVGPPVCLFIFSHLLKDNNISDHGEDLEVREYSSYESQSPSTGYTWPYEQKFLMANSLYHTTPITQNLRTMFIRSLDSQGSSFDSSQDFSL